MVQTAAKKYGCFVGIGKVSWAEMVVQVLLRSTATGQEGELPLGVRVMSSSGSSLTHQSFSPHTHEGFLSFQMGRGESAN